MHATDFSKPTEVNDVLMTFPAGIRHLMPKYEDIRDEYRLGGKWSNQLFSDWFFCGIKSADGLVAKEGIDKSKALRHIKTVMGSFEPKHEHKEAAVAFLLDKWFEPTSKWERAKAL